MHRNKLLAAFGLLIVAQIAVPVGMISGRESILSNGKEFRFITAPVDPTDYMRGKYVRLQFPRQPMPVRDTTYAGELYFAYLSQDINGFAKIDSLTHNRPKAGDYLEVSKTYRDSNMIHFTLPFDRFYMEESKAPAAEELYRKLPDSVKAFAKVRILEGDAVIEDVIVGGRPIGELAKEHLQK